MITEEKIKVDIHNGVYLDKTGAYFTIELGALKHKITGETIPGVKVNGLNNEGVETEEIVLVTGDDERIIDLCRTIHNSEYLGEL